MVLEVSGVLISSLVEEAFRVSRQLATLVYGVG